MAAPKQSVHVPQKDGEIVIIHRGNRTVYEVTDHTIKVPAADLDHILSSVEGARESKEAPAKPAATKDGK